ncbi:MAG: hypothetical protein ACXWJK_15890, partial [Burkholderiaceae bacterium]
ATDPKTGVSKKTTRCLIVFVAVDDSGDTIKVPSLIPVSDADHRLQKYTLHMVDHRKKQEEGLLEIDEPE